MQMRKTYNTTNKLKRAAEYRRAADECERAGFPAIAQVNWDEAMWLDPPREDEENEY